MIPNKKYKLEFILHTYNASMAAVRNSLAEFGAGVEISEDKDFSEKGKNFKVNIDTEDPTVIFDVCSQFGRIRSVKVDG